MSQKIMFIRMALVALAIVALTACVAPTAEPTKAPPAAAPTTGASGATAPAATKAPAPTAAPPTPAATKPVDIELWAQATTTQAGPPPESWVGYKTIREKLNINLKYVIIPTGADGETKLNAAAAANALPDFFQTASTSSERNKCIELNKQGLIAPIDDVLKAMPNRVKTHYDSASLALTKVDGKQMCTVEVPNLPRREGLVIRKDWLDKLGLKAPTTIDELLVVAKAFTEKDPDGNGKNDTYGLGGYWDSGTWGLGNRFDFFVGAYGLPDLWNFANPDKFGLNVRDPDFPKALAAFKQFVDAKVIDPDWATINRDEFRIRHAQGRYGIMWEDFAALANQPNYVKFDANFPTGEWAPLPALKGPTGKKSYYDAYGAIGSIFAMSKKAADAGKGPAIAKLLEWMASPEGYYLNGFGVEGVNYKLDKDGVVTTEGLPDPKLAWNAEATQNLTQMRNQLIYVNDPKEVQARYVDFKSKNGRTISPMSFYQFFSSQPWTDSKPDKLITFPANRADLKRFYDENILGFVLGTKPLTDQSWADFLKGLDSLGAAKWEAEAKKTLQDAGYAVK
ncbi:MAG: extracellular solute-binding protein [Chloroflexi bacterium]|nr:extracellular solute-binding protein [Chloroflexota bacterium]